MKKIIGLQIRTCNRDNKSIHDIGMLWEHFMKDGISAKIPGKKSDVLYAVYTEYEGDHMDPYEYLLGCEVDETTPIPKDMKSFEIPDIEYKKFTAKGKMPECIVKKWMEICNNPLERAFKVDYEVYNERAFSGEEGEVDIYVGIKESV